MSNEHGATFWCDKYNELKAQASEQIAELTMEVKISEDKFADLFKAYNEVVKERDNIEAEKAKLAIQLIIE